MPDKLNGLAAPSFRVPLCAPDAMVNVEVFPAFAFVVVIVPFTVSVPL